MKSFKMGKIQPSSTTNASSKIFSFPQPKSKDDTKQADFVLENYQKKISLPMNFADEILELEMICDDEDEVPEDKSIMRLIELYMMGAEYYESIRSSKYKYFIKKLKVIYKHPVLDPQVPKQKSNLKFAQNLNMVNAQVSDNVSVIKNQFETQSKIVENLQNQIKDQIDDQSDKIKQRLEKRRLMAKSNSTQNLGETFTRLQESPDKQSPSKLLATPDKNTQISSNNKRTPLNLEIVVDDGKSDESDDGPKKIQQILQQKKAQEQINYTQKGHTNQLLQQKQQILDPLRMLGDKKSVEVKEFTLKNKKKPKNLSIHINNEGDQDDEKVNGENTIEKMKKQIEANNDKLNQQQIDVKKRDMNQENQIINESDLCAEHVEKQLYNQESNENQNEQSDSQLNEQINKLNFESFQDQILISERDLKNNIDVKQAEYQKDDNQNYLENSHIEAKKNQMQSQEVQKQMEKSIVKNEFQIGKKQDENQSKNNYVQDDLEIKIIDYDQRQEEQIQQKQDDNQLDNYRESIENKCLNNEQKKNSKEINENLLYEHNQIDNSEKQKELENNENQQEKIQIENKENNQQNLDDLIQQNNNQQDDVKNSMIQKVNEKFDEEISKLQQQIENKTGILIYIYIQISCQRSYIKFRLYGSQFSSSTSLLYFSSVMDNCSSSVLHHPLFNKFLFFLLLRYLLSSVLFLQVLQ